ncbi:MAG: adenylyltransferase, partial [Deltaproteobacteria bacterium]|nr:adenylyltransferase [Deltaproteobacteria bacterium]
MSNITAPHGGVLKELIVPEAEAEQLKKEARDFVSWDLTERQLWDIEMLLNGGFSPLDGFMGKADYDSVVKKMRLASGIVWTMPITLDVTEAFAEKISAGKNIALRDPEGVLIAVMSVSDVWRPDKKEEALNVFKSDDTVHPGVNYLLN